MAFKLAECFVELKANGMEAVNASINGLRGNLTKLGSINVAGGLSATTARLQSAFSGLRSAATGLPGLVGSIGAVAIGKHMVGLAMDMEQATVSFKVMLGSAAAAKQLMGEIMQFAAATPYESPEVVNATKSLIAFGSSASTVIGEIRRLGDIASGVGMPIGELAQIYGKARVQGRLFAEDINQLTGRGIPIIGEIAKQLGISQSEVRKAVEKGNVNFGTIETAFKNLTDEGGRFHNMMEEQSKTMAGIASTAKDDLNAALRETGKIIGQNIIPLLAEGAKTAAAIGKALFPTEGGEAGTGKAASEQAALAKQDTGDMSVAGLKKKKEELRALQQEQFAKVQEYNKSNRGILDNLNDPSFHAFSMRGVGQMFKFFQSEFSEAEIGDAKKSIGELQVAIGQIDAELQNAGAGTEGKKSPIDSLFNIPLGIASKALAALPGGVSTAMSALKLDSKSSFQRAFSAGKTVKPGELGFERSAKTTEALGEATAVYAKKLQSLEDDLEAGRISQAAFTSEQKKAKEQLDAVNAKAAKPQYKTSTQLREAANKQYNDELARIDELAKKKEIRESQASAMFLAAHKARVKQLKEIDALEKKTAKPRVGGPIAGAGMFGAFFANQQRAVQRENKAAEEAKKIGEQHRTPMQEYAARMKDLDSIRDRGGFKTNPADYQRAAKSAKKDLDEALGYKPEFHTKKGQIADEERQYKERLADLERQKLDEPTRKHLRDRIDNAHSNRLADIDEQHKKPTVQMHGLTDFAKHIQQSLSQNPAEARREKRELTMVQALQQIQANTDPKNQQKPGPARFG